MRVWKCLAILLVVAGFSTSVFGQGIRTSAGNLYGKVVDERGDGLPGATVTLSGVGAPQTQSTDSKGQFRFVTIDPGTYMVKVELAGFASVEVKQVIVATGSNTELPVSMKLSPVAATVTVTGSPILDTRKERTGTNFSPEELANIPTSRDPWGILQMSAGVLTDNLITGANNSGQQSIFIAGGENLPSNQWAMDGIPITDQAATGASPTYYDFDAFQELQMNTGGVDPSVASAGVTVNFLTKRGTNVPHGSARVYDTPEETEATNTNNEISRQGLHGARIKNIQDYGAEVGGAAWTDHLWLWGAYGKSDIKRIASSGLPDNTQLTNYNVKVNASAIESNSLTLFYFSGDKTKQGRLPGNAALFLDAGTTWNQKGRSYFEKVEDSQTVGSNFFFTASYNFASTPFSLTPIGGFAVDNAVGTDSTEHNSYQFSGNYRPQHTVQGTGSYFFNTGNAGHELKFGGQYNTFTSQTTTFWPGDEVRGDCSVTGQGAGFPCTAAITRGSISGQSDKNINGFVGDTITWGNLTANVGVRFDTFYGYNTPSNIPANPSFPDILGNLNYPGGGAPFHTTTWSPRVGLTYAIGDQKTTLVRASYSKYADGFGVGSVGVTNPLGGVQTALYSWNGLCGGAACPGASGVNPFGNGTGRITTGDLGPFISPTGYDPNNPNSASSPNLIDSKLKAPVTNEFTAGVEHQFLPQLVAGVTYTHRKKTDFIWNCPLALDNVTGGVQDRSCISSSDYSLVSPGLTVHDNPHAGSNVYTTGPIYGVTNVPANYTYGVFETNRPDYNTTYDGITLQATKRLSDKWMMQGSFTWSNWKQHVSNVATGCIDPTNSVAYGTFGNYLGGNSCANNDKAYDFFGNTWINSEWQFAVSGLYQLPWNFNIAASIFGHQGYPTPYYVVVDTGDTINQTTGVDFVAVGKSTDHRMSSVYEVDASVQKVIPIASAADLTLSINCFNVFNTKTIIFRQSRTRLTSSARTPTAGLASNQQNPRVLSFGARVSF